MKIQNIFALIVTLVGFAACTSESELPNTPENGELVPVTINLGSLQTRSSVDLEAEEGVIKNAVIAIFEKSSGTPSAAPIVLENGATTGSTRVPLTVSNAYAFVNVSEEDIENLVNLAGNENLFKSYSVQKQLTQNANDLPKFGALEFTPTESGTVIIPVNQLTARVEVMVDVKVIKDEEEISNEGFSFAKSNLSWDNMSFNTENASTTGIDPNGGHFTTTINGNTYNTLNRAYSYPGATPTISLDGIVSAEGFSGVNSNLSYTFAKELVKDNVYIVRFVVTVDMSTPVTPTISYEVLAMETVSIDVPAFN